MTQIELPRRKKINYSLLKVLIFVSIVLQFYYKKRGYSTLLLSDFSGKTKNSTPSETLEGTRVLLRH